MALFSANRLSSNLFVASVRCMLSLSFDRCTCAYLPLPGIVAFLDISRPCNSLAFKLQQVYGS